MSDDLEKAGLPEAATPLEDAIMARLIDRVLEKAAGEGVDPHDAIKLAMPYLVRCAGAGRVAAEHLAKASSPSALIAQARRNQASVAAESARRGAWGRRIEAAIDQRNAAAAVAKCVDGLRRAERELATLQRAGADDHKLVMAEGSVALWTDRLGKSEQNLAEVQKKAGKVAP